MDRPDFVPFFREVIDHPNCTAFDAVVMGYIYWLTKLKNEKCTASNETLASLAKSTPQTITNALTILEKAGFIKRIFKDGNPKRDRLEIVCLLAFGRHTPTGVSTTHPQVNVLTPTGEQNKSIEREHITRATPNYRIEDENTKKPSKYKNARIVFSWFPRPEKSWVLNTTELKHAELLWDRGEDKVKKALVFVKNHEGEPYFPKILKPSDLERKWNDLATYGK